jgi:hypothetical protein
MLTIFTVYFDCMPSSQCKVTITENNEIPSENYCFLKSDAVLTMCSRRVVRCDRISYVYL